jgi:uncharacterized protein YaeQ
LALPSTIHRFQIQLSDTGRGVYEDLDLRIARHPSETVSFLLTRVFAYCIAFEEGIAFASGLSTPDDPALWVKDLTGRITKWIEVGLPAPDRPRSRRSSTATSRWTSRSTTDTCLSPGTERPRARRSRSARSLVERACFAEWALRRKATIP